MTLHTIYGNMADDPIWQNHLPEKTVTLLFFFADSLGVEELTPDLSDHIHRAVFAEPPAAGEMEAYAEGYKTALAEFHPEYEKSSEIHMFRLKPAPAASGMTLRNLPRLEAAESYADAQKMELE